jgi:hypothetical protein
VVGLTGRFGSWFRVRPRSERRKIEMGCRSLEEHHVETPLGPCRELDRRPTGAIQDRDQDWLSLCRDQDRGMWRTLHNEIGSPLGVGRAQSTGDRGRSLGRLVS